jgi:hypothetical protein
MRPGGYIRLQAQITFCSRISHTRTKRYITVSYQITTWYLQLFGHVPLN